MATGNPANLRREGDEYVDVSENFTARVVLTVTLNQQAWNAEYGDDESRSDIREAIKQWTRDSLVEGTRHLKQAGAVVDIELAS